MRTPVTGSFAVTDASDTSNFSGSVVTYIALSVTEARDTTSFTGGIYATGTMAVREDSDTASFTGKVIDYAVLNAKESSDRVDFEMFLYGNFDRVDGEPGDTPLPYVSAESSTLAPSVSVQSKAGPSVSVAQGTRLLVNVKS